MTLAVRAFSSTPAAAFLRAVKVTPAGHLAPSLIQARRTSVSSLERRSRALVTLFLGGMSFLALSGRTVVVKSLLFSALPGTMVSSSAVEVA